MKWQPLLLIFSLTLLTQHVYATDIKPQVIIKNFEFIPQSITIKRGQSIIWLNQEKRQYHSVWFEASGGEESDYLFPDESYQQEFKQAGTFPYRCGPHPKMTGTVIVTD